MKHRIKLTPNAHDSYKIGLNEVVGLKEAIAEVLKPVQTSIKERVYWNDCNLEEVEYKSRNGFIANSHNCGGLKIQLVIPKCESYNFCFIEFSECDGCNDNGTHCLGDDSKYPENGGECAYESEGHLDASLTVFLKFEGIQGDGSMDFYLVAFGGCDDAPYFRTKYSSDFFEAEFNCKTVKGLKRAASKHIKALLEVIKV